MTKQIFTLSLAAALFAWSTAVGLAQGLLPEVKAQLCREKKAGLAKLGAEAPSLHAQVAKLEGEYAAASQAETDAITRMNTRIQTPSGGVIEGLLDVGTFKAVEIAKKNREAARSKLDSAKERERYVGSQIFLLRDIIAGLNCDAPAPRAPVDLAAIDRLGRESHDQRYGGKPSPTSGSFGDPTSGPPIVIDPDYRGTGATSAPGQQEQPYRDPYYPLPGPFVGLVPVPVPVIPVPPPHTGGKGGKGHGDPPKGCHYKPGTKELHCGKD